MSRYYSYLNSSVDVLQRYKGAEPFPIFLKNYFAQDKKFGSTDRKRISHLCYSYFRLGKALMDLPTPDRILIGLFLSNAQSDAMLAMLKPGLNEQAGLSLEDKIRLLEEEGHIMSGIFPWKDELSEGIDLQDFQKSFFTQPDLFLRLRPGMENIVRNKLSSAGLLFDSPYENCLSLANSTKLEGVITLDKEAVVQDLNSQRVGEFMKLPADQKFNNVWDCCAASGGKSIMAYDRLPGMELTVSDNRESIIHNLRKRFKTAGIDKYRAFITDLAMENRKDPITKEKFSLIIADLPCTGSGTWGRSPEQLFYFSQDKIDQYALLQRKILGNIIPQLQAGGFLLYSTCSVFRRENEDNVSWITANSNLRLERMELLKGYDRRADSLFAALFRRL